MSIPIGFGRARQRTVSAECWRCRFEDWRGVGEAWQGTRHATPISAHARVSNTLRENYSALQYAEEALLLERQLDDQQHLAELLPYSALCRTGLGQYLQARQDAENSLHCADKQDDLYIEGLASIMLAINCMRSNQLDDAQQAIAHTAKLAALNHFIDFQLQSRVLLGHIYAAQGHFEEAEAGFMSGEELARQAGNLMWRGRLEIGLVHLHLAKGQYGLARTSEVRSVRLMPDGNSGDNFDNALRAEADVHLPHLYLATKCNGMVVMFMLS